MVDTLPATALRLSIVVCCYTAARRGQVIQVVDSALEQIVVAGDEVIVVVDHNDDLFVDLSEALPASVIIVPNGADRGLSGARNTGVAQAANEIVVFVDDDALLTADALDGARHAFGDPSIVAIGGAVDADWQAGSAPAWFPREYGWVVGCDYRGLPACGEQIRNPIGAAMAVRRDALQRINGFSTRLGRVGDLPAGCEETLMGVQLREQFPDRRIIRHTAFRVTHHVPSTRATVRYFLRRCYQEGRSKASLTRIAGGQHALSSERSYTTRILPSGVWQARAAPGRLLALLVGFLCTATGFAVGLLFSVGQERGR